MVKKFLLDDIFLKQRNDISSGRLGELKRGLEKVIAKLEKDANVNLALLFGSLAKGEAGSGSDIDLIVVKKTDKRFLDRLDEFYEDMDVAMDILVYTPEEFEQIRKRSFIKKAFEEGIIIYESQFS